MNTELTLLTAIPSKNRLNYTAGKIFPNHILFVEPQDEKKYEEAFPKQDIITLKENDKGFSYVLNYITEVTLNFGKKYFLFVDDDIWGVLRKDKAPFNPEEMIEEGLAIMRKNGYAQLGISFKGHNWFAKEELEENKAIWGMAIIDAEAVKNAGGYDNNLILFSDYDITASLIKKGYKVAVWNKYMFEHKMKSQEGGAMTYYKKAELIKAQCEYLQKKWGEDCKTMFNAKHGIYEVRLNWRSLSKKQKASETDDILAELGV